MRMIAKSLLHKYFSFMEKRVSSQATEPRHKPIFIIGPPRSGTTLIYQLLVNSFHVTYISNFSNRFFLWPAAASKIWKIPLQRYKTDYTSHYGKTYGASAPSEANNLWKRWFPEDEYPIDETYVSDKMCREMRTCIAAIETVLGGLFVNKDVHHSSRVLALDKIFPGCLFIRMRRNLFDNACAIWNTRKRRAERRQDYQISDWLSLKPKEYSSLKNENPMVQVCGQVFYAQRNISEYAKIIGERRVLDISYERLCEEPIKEIQKIEEFAMRFGEKLIRKYDIPPSFSQSMYAVGESPEYKKIRKILDSMINGYDKA